MAERRVLVVGLNRFGKALVTTLWKAKAEVVVIDSDPEEVADVKESCSAAFVGDVADPKVLAQIGAQEVDVVMPWREPAAAPALLAAVRQACRGLTLKVILETGVLADDDAVRRTCRVALDAGADFLKTSTGKAPVNATPQAARLLLQAIAGDAAARGRVGFKPAGGIRTVADAAVYVGLVREHLGDAALTPARFRIGASALLDDIEAVLAGVPRPPETPAPVPRY